MFDPDTEYGKLRPLASNLAFANRSGEAEVIEKTRMATGRPLQTPLWGTNPTKEKHPAPGAGSGQRVISREVRDRRRSADRS
jgi:hypothetical protein